MATKKNTEEKPDYSGQGGSYLQDPVSGKVTLVERTQPAEALSETNQATEE